MLVILEILKYVLPSAFVFLACFFVIKEFMRKEEQERNEKWRMESRKLISPVRLQAYERIILLLERISPENLLLRVSRPDLTSGQLHSQMLKSVREEYEHNLSQQLYISPQAWQWVKNAKEEVISLINTAAGSVSAEDSASNLGMALMEKSLGKEKISISKAIDYVKKELQSTF